MWTRGPRAHLEVDCVHPDGLSRLPSDGLVLELEYSPRTHVRAHAAADAGGALHVLVGLGVGADVDAHLAVGRAVAAGDAHVLLHGDAEPAELLDESQEGGHGAGEAAPDARAHERVEPHAEDAGEDGPHPEAVPLLDPEGEGGELRVALSDRPVEADDHGGDDGERQHRVDGNLLELPGLGGLVREVAPGLPEGVGEAAAAADPRAVEALAQEVAEDGEEDERSQEAPDDDQEGLAEDDGGVEVLDLERPEVGEVVLLLLEDLQHDREREGENDLDEEDAQRTDALVAVVAVPAEEEHAAHQDRQRVEDAVEGPLAVEARSASERLEDVEADAEPGDGAEIEEEVEGHENERHEPSHGLTALDGVVICVEKTRLHGQANSPVPRLPEKTRNRGVNSSSNCASWRWSSTQSSERRS